MQGRSDTGNGKSGKDKKKSIKFSRFHGAEAFTSMDSYFLYFCQFLRQKFKRLQANLKMYFTISIFNENLEIFEKFAST